MISRVKLAGIILALAFASYMGWTMYNYFLSANPPVFEFSGLEEGGYYGGDVACVIKGSDDFTVCTLSVWLDGKPLATNFKINRRSFEHQFGINTKTLANGKHTLRIEVTNGTYKQLKAAKEFVFFVDNTPLQAAFIRGDVDNKVFQGRTLHLQFQVNKEIKEARVAALSKNFMCVQENPRSLIYEAFVPIDCEETPNEYPLTIEITDKTGNTLTMDSKFQVVMFPFKKQTLHNMNSDKMKEENEAGHLSEKDFEREVEELTAHSPAHKLWQGAFIPPVEIKEKSQVTSDFGVIRATQERGLRQHKAIDLYAMPRSVIWAPQDGVVVMKNRYAHSGNTVIIDHGCGILSMFFHLDSYAAIEVGEKIKRGNPIGKLGKTGYATGYHLHWEMRINNIAIDPMQWTKLDF